MNARDRLAAALGQVLAGVDEWDTIKPDTRAFLRSKADAILAADPHLAQDIEDGRGVRELREVLPAGQNFAQVYTPYATSEPDDPDQFEVTVIGATVFRRIWGTGPTLAAAVEACRAALEGTDQ